MNKAMALLAAAAALGAVSPASAQSWSGWGNGYGNNWNRGGYGYDNGYGNHGGGFGFDSAICSGQRARGLEAKLNHEWREGEIDPRTARRIHDQIDRLEDNQRDECREGDWRGIRRIADRFDRIEQWIDREAHGYARNRW